jgi:uncharacterized membrane protein YdjX (TVP38/TMEM64 family)
MLFLIAPEPATGNHGGIIAAPSSSSLKASRYAIGVRWLLGVTALLLLTLIPFFLFEEDMSRWSSAMLVEARSSSWASATMIVLLLASDILLPVPSSLVGAYAGGVLGIAYGAVANWVGLSLGSAIGYGLGRSAGRPAFVRLVGADAVDRARGLFARMGPAALLVSRGIPVVAEAGLIAAGSASMPLASFIGSVAIGNAAVAIAYAVAGSAASTGNYALLVAVLVLVPAASWLMWRALKGPAIAR